MNTVRTVRVIQTEAGAILQNTDNGATFSTNFVGSRIWGHLTKGLTQDEIVDQVSTEFRAPRDQVCGDVEKFLEGLEQTGFIQKEVNNA